MVRLAVVLGLTFATGCGGKSDDDSGTTPTGTTTTTATGSGTGTGTGATGTGTGATGTGTGAGTGTGTGSTNDCGNGLIDVGEACDGTSLDGEDCVSQGYDRGNLHCALDCMDFDVSSCEQDVSNLAAPCATTSQLVPDPGEDGYLAGSRLTPPFYPFTLTRVRYTLVGPVGSSCDASLEHSVDIFTGTGTTPDASPTVHESIVVPYTATTAGYERNVEVTLANPLTVNAGEEVFIGIRTGGGFPIWTCMQTCSDAGAEATRNWWSNADAAPYSWVTMSSLGINTTLQVEMTGSP